MWWTNTKDLEIKWLLFYVYTRSDKLQIIKKFDKFQTLSNGQIIFVIAKDQMLMNIIFCFNLKCLSSAMHSFTKKVLIWN